jgi:hypothetical protein
MARHNDNSHDLRHWTNRKLIAEARRVANFENFGSYFRADAVAIAAQGEAGDFIREETRLYRDTWLNPVLDEIERRFVKAR